MLYTYITTFVRSRELSMNCIEQIETKETKCSSCMESKMMTRMNFSFFGCDGLPLLRLMTGLTTQNKFASRGYGHH